MTAAILARARSTSCESEATMCATRRSQAHDIVQDALQVAMRSLCVYL